MLESRALFLAVTFGTLHSDSLNAARTPERLHRARKPEIPVERRVMIANIQHADERSRN